MSKLWWVKLPGEAYANEARFRVEVSERDAREWARARLGVKRLPNDTEVWAG